jgi:hypothetical protein
MIHTLLFLGINCGTAERVKLLSTPDGGIQPQAAVDGKGVVHLIYYKGDPGGGDLFYIRREPGQESFSKPLRVNGHPGTAMAAGTIRGAQLALGKSGRVHIAWNGAGEGATALHASAGDETPLLYTRLNDAGTEFEAERNLITYAYGLDGGSSVAADPQGNVYVTWHAPQPGNTNGEGGRAVFVARSNDEGKTFQRETLATSERTGACGCCGLRALADASGAVYVLFRAATEKINRDETLLISQRPGADFQIASRHEWKASTCPMSSASLTEGKGGTLAAWETPSQVYFSHIDPKTLRVSRPISPPGANSRKQPVAVSNDSGETLLVWTEGTSWGKGGAVAFQVFDKDDKPALEKGRAEGLKVWSLPTAFAEPDSSFVIVY